MSLSGFVNAGLQLGLQSIVISPVVRGITGITLPDGSTMEDIVAQATIEERHADDLEVTEHPLQQGASIADHAYKRPARLVLQLGWSNSPTDTGGLVSSALGLASAVNPAVQRVMNAAGVISGAIGIGSALMGSNVDQVQAIYQQLLFLQEQRALFSVQTAKRTYVDMICRSLSTETDYRSANSLPITMVCQQVILVDVQTVQLPASTQRTPQSTASPIDSGVQYPRKLN